MHDAARNEASLGIMHGGLGAHGEGGLEGSGHDFAVAVAEGEGAKGGRGGRERGKVGAMGGFRDKN